MASNNQQLAIGIFGERAPPAEPKPSTRFHGAVRGFFGSGSTRNAPPSAQASRSLAAAEAAEASAAASALSHENVDTLVIENGYRELARTADRHTESSTRGGRRQRLTWRQSMIRWTVPRLGLLGWVLLALALLTLIQAIAWVIVRWVLPESFKDDVLVNQVAGILDVAIGFLYIAWFLSFAHAFVAPYTRYATYNIRLRTLQMHTYNIVLGFAANSATPSAIVEAESAFFNLFQLLYIYAYRMSSRIDNYIRLNDVVPPDSVVSLRLGAILMDATHPFSVFVAGISLYETLLTELEAQLKRAIGVRDNTRCIDDALRRLHESNEETYVSSRVRTPWLLRDHLGFILGFFFLVITPVTFAVQFDLAALVIYPVASFLLLGNYVYMKFLGDPFLALPDFTGMDTVQWREERLEETLERHNRWSAQLPPPSEAGGASSSSSLAGNVRTVVTRNTQQRQQQQQVTRNKFNNAGPPLYNNVNNNVGGGGGGGGGTASLSSDHGGGNEHLMHPSHQMTRGVSLGDVHRLGAGNNYSAVGTSSHHSSNAGHVVINLM